MAVDGRKARWRDDVVTEVVEIPLWDDEMKESLFYGKMDYFDFQVAEQRRYDKLMSKQIQKMVYEKIGPQLQATIDRGATAEEVEAMMPQTTEAILALLGDIPQLNMLATVKGESREKIRKGDPDRTDGNQKEILSSCDDKQDSGNLIRQHSGSSVSMKARVLDDSPGNSKVSQGVETNSTSLPKGDTCSSSSSSADSIPYSRTNEVPPFSSTGDRHTTYNDVKAESWKPYKGESGKPSGSNYENSMETEVQSPKKGNMANRSVPIAAYAASNTSHTETESVNLQDTNSQPMYIPYAGRPVSDTGETSRMNGINQHNDIAQPMNESSFPTTEEVHRENTDQRLEVLRRKLMKMTAGC